MYAEGGDNLLQRLWSGVECVFGVVWSLVEDVADVKGRKLALSRGNDLFWQKFKYGFVLFMGKRGSDGEEWGISQMFERREHLQRKTKQY